MTSTRREEINKDRLVNDLKKIGVAKGDHLAVTLSFKSIGCVLLEDLKLLLMLCSRLLVPMEL